MQQSFPKLFNDNRPELVRHSASYRRFSKDYGITKAIYSAADDKITEVEKIHQIYLLDFFQYLIYESDNAYAQKADEEFHDQQRRLKRH